MPPAGTFLFRTRSAAAGNASMAIATDQATVLEAVVARLRDQVQELRNESVCYVSDFPQPPQNVQHNFYASISPTDGQFDEGEQIGAGSETLIEQTGVVVTCYSRMKLDRTGKATHLLFHEDRGLLAIKKEILAALASHRLLDSDGNELLVAYMHASQSSAPRYDPEAKMGVMALHFHTDFQWDLS